MNYALFFESLRKMLDGVKYEAHEAGPYHLSKRFVERVNQIGAINRPASVYNFEYDDREDQDKAEQMIRAYVRHELSLKGIPMNYETATEVFNGRS